ncbi:MAG: hypothetical protein ACLFPD_07605 [Desulfosudaceae bacterium]
MKGAYCLFIRVKEKSEIRVGALGPVMFARGLYAYVGSAQNGLAAGWCGRPGRSNTGRLKNIDRRRSCLL